MLKSLSWGSESLDRAYYVSEDSVPVRLWVRANTGAELTVDVLLDGVSVFSADEPRSLMQDRTQWLFAAETFETAQFDEGAVVTLKLTGGRDGLSVQLDLAAVQDPGDYTEYSTSE